jgi:sporulation protein YlmC with PRC-barrel domain
MSDDRFGELESLGSWTLVNDDQDIRGYPVSSASGATYGTIEDLLVDKDKEHVAAVRLNDGRIVAAANLEIRDRQVIYHDDGAASRTDYTRVRRPAS